MCLSPQLAASDRRQPDDEFADLLLLTRAIGVSTRAQALVDARLTDLITGEIPPDRAARRLRLCGRTTQGSMTRDKNSAAQTRDQILAEHREIAALSATIAAAADSKALAAGLERLEPLLESHFRREESQEGLHEAIELKAPHHQGDVSWLEDEHREILAEVTRLARATEGDENAVRRDCENLFAKMRAHEARETEVFLDSVWSDLGVGD